MPLVAQVTGAVALTALIVGPWWAATPDAIQQQSPVEAATAAAPVAAETTAPATSAATLAATSAEAPPAVAPTSNAGTSVIPAHLNFDVRHSFKTVDFAVTVDGKPAFSTKLEGSGKKFGVFGKRSERGYTRTIDLTPGAHIVRVRVLSTADKFDQTRVERFDLGSASVATLRISADKSGLSLVADRPPSPGPGAVASAAETVTSTPPAAVPAPVPVQAANVAVPQTAAVTASRQDVNAVADLLQSVRSMLIAIAGFVASAATGFVVQEYLRSRPLPFAKSGADGEPGNVRQRRRRFGKPRPQPVNENDYEDDEVLPAGDREST
jgi:hypothetical protein